MPRKVYTGIDYDDDTAYDDDYDYDYEYDVEVTEEAPKPQPESTKVNVNVWRCSICTYDNEEGLPACDICGVLRKPVAKNLAENEKTVDGICKDSGASIMAKSLFASLPHQTSKKAVESRLRNGDFMMQGGANFHLLGNNQRQVHEFAKASSCHSHSRPDIAPFKFDVPSPDDVVSNGLRSTKLGSKANIPSSSSSKVSTTVTGKKGGAPSSSTAKSSESSHLDGVMNMKIQEI